MFRGACIAAEFFRSADPERAYRRYVIDPHHEHWLAGCDAGQRATEQATQRYLRDQLLPLRPTADANESATSATVATGADAAAPDL